MGILSASASEVVVRSGHTADITSLLFVASDSLLVSGSEDGTIRVWSPDKGNLLAVLRGHAGAISGLDTSADGKELISAGIDGLINIWSIETGTATRQLPVGAPIHSLSCSRSNAECAIASEKGIFVFSLSASGGLRQLAEVSATSLTYLPDGHRLAVSSFVSPGMRILDSQTGTSLGEARVQNSVGHLQAVGTYVVGASNYDVVTFDTSNGLTQKASATSQASINSITLDHRTERIFAAATGTTIPTWTVGSASPSEPMPVPEGIYSAVAFDSKGSYVATGMFDGSLQVLDRQTLKPLYRVGGDTNSIYEIGFNSDGSLSAIGGQGNTVRNWLLGPDERQTSFFGHILGVTNAMWAGKRKILISVSPMQITAWDTITQRMISQIQTQDIDGWPATCSESGVCAWGEAGNLVVRNILDNSPPRTFPLGADVPLSLDISPDGMYLAASVNTPRVRIWSLKSGDEESPLALTVPSELASTTIPQMQRWQPKPKLYVPYIGMASVVKFLPDGSLLASNEVGIHMWGADRKQPPHLMKGYTGHLTAIVLGSQPNQIYTTGDDRSVRVWDIGAGTGHTLFESALIPKTLSASPAKPVIAVEIADGELQLWQASSGKLLGSLTFTADGGWLLVTPSGLFEASENAWRSASFRLDGEIKHVLPMEALFRNYYEPGLLSELVLGEETPQPSDPGKLNRDAPQVSLTTVSSKPASATLDAASGELKQNPATVRFRVVAKEGQPGAGVTDVKVTQNDLVVRHWSVKFAPGHPFVQEFDLPLIYGPNTVSAFAYNNDQIQSQQDNWRLPAPNYAGFMPLPALYVLAIGITEYKDKRFRVPNSSADAQLLAKSLDPTDSEWDDQNRRLLDWAAHRSIDQLHDGPLEMLPKHTVQQVLLDSDATRENILAAIRDLVHRAQPQDALIIFFSGHGIARNNRFYLLPYDQAITDARLDQVSTQAVQAAAPSLISDRDLERELEDLNVAHGALILDACQSGQALAGSEFRGPVFGSNLGRLAYEKGIYLLAASDSSESARPLGEKSQSALTYALVQEGLLEFKADTNPVDGKIDLREWLAYASSRVPSLIRESFRSETGQTALQEQHPRFSPRRVPETSLLVLAVSKKQP
jgi:WD40 repeat protein